MFDDKTKIILRLHTKPSTRGLNIYNPFFQKSGINAVYLLRYGDNLPLLINGMRSLSIDGAITAGFENDSELPYLLDDLTKEASFLQRVTSIFKVGNKLIGHNQSGIGLFNSIIASYPDLDLKRIVILGAGTVAKGLILEIEKHKLKTEVIVVNRTIAHAEKVAELFPSSVTSIKPIDELFTQNGDIFVNATEIGSVWNVEENLIFPSNFIKQFSFVSDVTFIPIKSELIKKAERLNIRNSPGYKMFLYQAEEAMKKIIGDQKYDLELYEKIMIRDFRKNWN